MVLAYSLDGFQPDGGEHKSGAGELPLCAGEDDFVDTCGAWRDETPAPTAGYSLVKTECGGETVRHLIQSPHIGSEAGNSNDLPQQKIEQIQLVGCQVVKITGAGKLLLYPPWQLFPVIIIRIGRYGKTDLDRGEPT